MLNFSVGDIAGAFGVDSKIGGLDLDKINVGEVLGLGEGTKKKKKKNEMMGMRILSLVLIQSIQTKVM